MGDRIYKYLIGETRVNLVEVVAFYIAGDSLVVETTGATMIFNEPKDVDDVEAALTELEAAFDTLQAELEAADQPETPEEPDPEEP